MHICSVACEEGPLPCSTPLRVQRSVFYPIVSSFWGIIFYLIESHVKGLKMKLLLVTNHNGHICKLVAIGLLTCICGCNAIAMSFNPLTLWLMIPAAFPFPPLLQEIFGEVQAAVSASGGYLQIPDLYINMANVALAKAVS